MRDITHCLCGDTVQQLPQQPHHTSIPFNLLLTHLHSLPLHFISCHTIILRVTLYHLILPGNLISHSQAWSSPCTQNSQKTDPSPLQGTPQKAPSLHLFRHRGHRPSRYGTTYLITSVYSYSKSEPNSM